jgi:rubrerythrin
MFSGLLNCADCGKPLWYHTNPINKDIHFFSCSNYAKDYRGSCKSRHYIRADSLEQIVKLELRGIAECLRADEDAFAELLAQKTNKDMLAEKKQIEDDLQKAVLRNETVLKLYEKVYEDNAAGKVTDEFFMQLSHKYEVERMELKGKISTLRRRLVEMDSEQRGRDAFLAAIRKFMEMERLTAPLLRELIDHIDVYETEGTGKSRTQRVVIHYRFVGYLELPENVFRQSYKADTRQGVCVEYLRTPVTA